MASFSIARDREKLIPYIKAALQVKPDIHLWASPWIVPAWMMDSGRNMKSDAQTLGAHALYMAKFVEEYAQGRSEDRGHSPPERARLRAGPLDAVALHQLHQDLPRARRSRSETSPREIWCGTMSKDPDDTNIAKAVAADRGGADVRQGLRRAVEPASRGRDLAQKGPVMQTEHKCGNYNFSTPYWDQSRYNANMAQNDHLYGEESWQLIRDWIVAGVNSYSAWNMVLDTVGKSLDNWPQNALLVVDRSAKKLIVDAGLLRLPALLPVHRRGRDAHRDQRQQRRGRLQEPRRQHRRRGLQQGHRGEDDDRRGRQRAVTDAVPVRRPRPRMGDAPPAAVMAARLRTA